MYGADGLELRDRAHQWVNQQLHEMRQNWDQHLYD
jgi:hypothetical protein